MWPFRVFGAASARFGQRHKHAERPPCEPGTVGAGLCTVGLDPTVSDDGTIWSKRLKVLFNYWQARRGDAARPSRADIDPLDIPDILPIVFLVDVEHMPLDFRFRLVGSEFAQKYGCDFTGRRLRDINQHAQYEAILSDYTQCAETGAPLVSRNSFINARGVYWKYERVLLPLGGPSGPVNMILGGIDINIPQTELTRFDRVRNGVPVAPRPAGARPDRRGHRRP